MERVDKNTISELRNGSHRAFELVFNAFFGRIKAFIHGYVKSEADAEELAEEVFVGLWTGRERLDPERSLGSYLHTVARNTALNFLRHKYVCDAYAGKIASGEAVPTSEEELVAAEIALLVEMTVEKMPAQRREIYRLSRVEGLKNDEIADRLSTTKRNVESQLSLALRDIRRAISAILIILRLALFL